ncbi:MAG: retroviral-like aspartic protease family protein [Firmicutes bacterium]|nr:retroviral-like aspartic protease family protein [Bacillota bacterium]
MSLCLAWAVKSRKTMTVDCEIFSANKKSKYPVNLLIDTGATRTSISRYVACGILGYTDLKKDTHSVITPTGIVKFDMVKISRIELGGEFAFSNFNANILDWKNFALHGIVGMDILSKLHIHSDTKIFAIQDYPFNIAQNT